MGLKLFGGNSASSYDQQNPGSIVEKKPTYPNPDPKSFVILEVFQAENYLMAHLKYLGCTNYEGEKILVYKDVFEGDFRDWSVVDPHFSKDFPEKSPIARFIPTLEGWEMAKMLIYALIDIDEARKFKKEWV